MAIKEEAIKTYIALAERFIELPRGVTIPHILLETLAFFSKESIKTGRVAEEELVEKAVIKEEVMAFKC